jgi:hypothetical protein
VRLFQRLLAAYPRQHRREYGPAMAQLFRDQCRDAWGEGREQALIWLWLRVLPDLVKTSVVEHISTLNERKTMLDRMSTLLRPRSAPWIVFVAVFAVVYSDNYFPGLATIINICKSHFSFLTQPQLKLS